MKIPRMMGRETAAASVTDETGIVSAALVRAAARDSHFELVGMARAEPLDPVPLGRWLDAGYGADMHWMRRRMADRLDPTRVLAGAKTVVALGIPYRRPGTERSRIASYARGRDYHYSHRDRMRALRKRLLVLDPGMETYACVDTGVAMEKVWAERAGLGFIGKNGLLITGGFGSWVTLSVMFLDREVDVYDVPGRNLCGDCTRCLSACPTAAIPSPGVVDARRCVAYQSIENRDLVPRPLRKGFVARVFGCDVCQDVCPFNHDDIPAGDQRFAPRPLALLTSAQIAALTESEFNGLAAGMAVVRAGYDGLRRNAVLALGAARDRSARSIIAGLRADDSAIVSEAATWALDQIDRVDQAGRLNRPGSP
jgi:epoxyqueuosine reductase